MYNTRVFFLLHMLHICQLLFEFQPIPPPFFILFLFECEFLRFTQQPNTFLNRMFPWYSDCWQMSCVLFDIFNSGTYVSAPMDKGFSLKMTSAQATEVTIGQGLSPAGISLLVISKCGSEIYSLKDRTVAYSPDRPLTMWIFLSSQITIHMNSNV